MGKLPKDKVTLSVYVTPKCKEKLECLQQLYFIAGKRFSLSQIVEETIHIMYNTAYLCQDSVFWKGFIKIFRVFEASEATNSGIDEVLGVAQRKKAATKEILNVPVSIKDNAIREFKKMVSKD